VHTGQARRLVVMTNSSGLWGRAAYRRCCLGVTQADRAAPMKVCNKVVAETATVAVAQSHVAVCAWWLPEPVKCNMVFARACAGSHCMWPW
jgi:hypothetical protein